jgi:hypothetical protein
MPFRSRDLCSSTVNPFPDTQGPPIPVAKKIAAAMPRETTAMAAVIHTMVFKVFFTISPPVS